MRPREARSWVLAILAFIQAPAIAVEGIPADVPEELLREVENSYIFVFTDEVGNDEVRGLARRLAATEGGAVRHVFSKALKGFSARVSEAGATRIASAPSVAYYEPNGIVWASYRGVSDAVTGALGRGPGPGSVTDTEPPAEVLPWGIARIGGPRDGTGRHAWVIDSGIDLDHPDLNVGTGADLVDGDASPDDEFGHGTHDVDVVVDRTDGASHVGAMTVLVVGRGVAVHQV